MISGVPFCHVFFEYWNACEFLPPCHSVDEHSSLGEQRFQSSDNVCGSPQNGDRFAHALTSWIKTKQRVRSLICYRNIMPELCNIAMALLHGSKT